MSRFWEQKRNSSPGGVKVDDDELAPRGLELRLEVRLVFDLVHHLVALPVPSGL